MAVCGGGCGKDEGGQPKGMNSSVGTSGQVTEDPGQSVRDGVLKRGLAAILSGDVSGYGRLMHADEEGTVRLLTDSRAAISRCVAQHDGRVVDMAGDSVLAVFPSVTGALRSAVDIQRELAKRNASLPPADRMQFRLGVHLGEILLDDDAPYGDVVNLAARIEGLAEPGGICISEAVHSQVQGQVNFRYAYLGRRQVKNSKEPVPVYRVDWDAPPGWHRARRWRIQPLIFPAGAVLVLVVFALVFSPEQGFSPMQSPDSPPEPPAVLVGEPPGSSIAVLPFENLSPEPDQDYFSDGITADLITDLSNLSGLLVIARNTSFAQRRRDLSPQVVGKELGVRYLLEGSVRRAGDRVRITAQLIDAESGHHIWGGRYDGALEDIFALQDDVTRKIVSALQVTVTEAEHARLVRRQTDHLDAYDRFLQGQSSFFEFTAEGNARARTHYERAIELDPAFARAVAALALTHAWDYRWDWSREPAASLSTARELVGRAMVLDDSVPQVRWVHAYVVLLHGEFEQALAQARYAIALDPNYADGYGLLAFIHVAMGDAREALAAMDRAVLLNPHYSVQYHSVLGATYLLLGRYDAAARVLTEGVLQNHRFLRNHVLLAAAYGKQGRLDDAAWVAEEIRALSPEFSIGYWKKSESFRDPATLEFFAEGLRLAGVPE
jgi:adenylate cyclase